MRRVIGSVWPFGQIFPWYVYTVKLSNMKFGGADPSFNDEFTWCNYIIKYYTLGLCGLCGMKVKRWVDSSIVMGEPKFDEDMAKEDAEADAANPTDLNRRYTNQSMSGPPGFQDPNRAVSFNTGRLGSPRSGSSARDSPSSPGVEMYLRGKQASAEGSRASSEESSYSKHHKKMSADV